MNKIINIFDLLCFSFLRAQYNLFKMWNLYLFCYLFTQYIFLFSPHIEK